ncbi:MAG: iron ABC transporter permease, partial [Proteobacteria bacterium]|nr:iron ABC transporter permease [Pseudomonadota bacterium]
MSGPPVIARAALVWSAMALLAAVLLPWYGLEDGLASGGWIAGLWSTEEAGSGLAQVVAHGRWWLAPVLVALVLCFLVSIAPMTPGRRGTALVLASGAGLGLFAAQAFGIGLRGWNGAWLTALFG